MIKLLHLQQVISSRSATLGSQSRTMPLPPPPPRDRRFIIFLTEEGERAIRAGSGPLYDLMIEVLMELNPQCFSSREEVEEVLPDARNVR